MKKGTFMIKRWLHQIKFLKKQKTKNLIFLTNWSLHRRACLSSLKHFEVCYIFGLDPIQQKWCNIANCSFFTPTYYDIMQINVEKNTFMALLIITMHSIAIYILSHVFLSPKKVITFVITLYPVSFSLKITKVLP